MWIFGHLGIGSKLAQPLGRKLPYGWLLLGTLLPDLIDKPLYYGISWATGLKGESLGLISCTRTFGHTGIFLVLLLVAAWLRRSREWAALALGVATHLALDLAQDQWAISSGSAVPPSSAFLALTFPFSGGRFGIMPFGNLGEHLKSVNHPDLLFTEAAGLLILLWDDWKSRKLRSLRIPRLWKKPRSGRRKGA